MKSNVHNRTIQMTDKQRNTKFLEEWNFMKTCIITTVCYETNDSRKRKTCRCACSYSDGSITFVIFLYISQQTREREREACIFFVNEIKGAIARF